MKEVIFTREEFYKLIWSEQYSSLAKRFDITPQSLKHRCDSYTIPVPTSKYWAAIKTGKNVEIPALPETNTADQQIELFLWEDSNESEINISSLIEYIKAEIESQSGLPSFSETFLNPDTLVTAAQKTFKENEKKGWTDRGLIWCKKGELDITVSPENVDRALRFIDTLIKLLRKSGNDVIVSHDGTYAVMNGEKLKILIREKLKMGEKNDSWGGRHDFLKTGKLSLRVDELYSPIEWVDGLERLEEQLPRILYKLDIKGKREKERSLY